MKALPLTLVLFVSFALKILLPGLPGWTNLNPGGDILLPSLPGIDRSTTFFCYTMYHGRHGTVQIVVTQLQELGFFGGGGVVNQIEVVRPLPPPLKKGGKS